MPLKDIFHELLMDELYELCPDDRGRVELARIRIGCYRSSSGFSAELLKFIQRHDIQVGNLVTKNSPVYLENPLTQEEEMPKETQPKINFELAGALVFLIPEILVALETETTCVINYDESGLSLGEAKKSRKSKEEIVEEETPKRGRKPKQEPASKKAKQVEEEEEEAAISQEEFDELLETSPEEAEELAESMGITWEVATNKAINRVRLKKAVYTACGWKLPK